jgi:hypothetical protein
MCCSAGHGQYMHCTAPPERYICFVLQFEGSAVGRQSCVQAYACMYVHGNSSLTMSGPCTCTQQLTQHVQGMHTSADSVCARVSVCKACTSHVHQCARVCSAWRVWMCTYSCARLVRLKGTAMHGTMHLSTYIAVEATRIRISIACCFLLFLGVWGCGISSVGVVCSCPSATEACW